MDDSALLGLKQNASQMVDDTRHLDSTVTRGNHDAAEKRDVVNKLTTEQSNQFINIEDQ